MRITALAGGGARFLVGLLDHLRAAHPDGGGARPPR